MIKSFKHKGLEKLFLRGVKSGIQVKHADRIRLILGRLHASTSAEDMNLPQNRGQNTVFSNIETDTIINYIGSY